MKDFEYVGDYPIILAGVVLGDGVEVVRGEHFPDDTDEQEDGQSPVLYPHDHISLPDDHTVVHGSLIGEGDKHAGETQKDEDED